MKRKVHKIISMLAAMVMVIGSLSLTAFAEEDNNTSASTHTYELFQIFKGTFDESGVLSDIEWGYSAKDSTLSLEDTEDGDGVLTELDAVSNDTEGISDSDRLAVIKEYVDFTKPYKSGKDGQPTYNADEKSYTYENIDEGYYLIRDAANSQTGEADFYTLYVVKSSGKTLTFEPKGSVPSVDKQIDDNGMTSINSASIGDEVNFVITGEVSSRIADFASYYYKFNDTLSKGLDFKDDSLKVYLVNPVEGSDPSKEDVTKYFYHKATKNDESGQTVLVVAIGDLKALAKVGYTISASSQVVVEYKATLNKDAFIGMNADGTTGNTNEVYLVYSNDPNNSGTPATENPPENPDEEPKTTVPTGESVKSTTQTYTTSLTLTKVMGSDNTPPLEGAVFTLTGNGVKQVLVTELAFEKAEGTTGEYYLLKDGTYTKDAPILTDQADGTKANKDLYVLGEDDTYDTYNKTKTTILKGESTGETTVSGTVDKDGVITFSGLGAGTYTLEETVAPAGYNKMSPITFVIKFNENDSKQFSIDYEGCTYNEKTGTFQSKVPNYPGTTLPHTGGMGRTWLYMAGSLLAAAAVILLVVKRRMRAER